MALEYIDNASAKLSATDAGIYRQILRMAPFQFGAYYDGKKQDTLTIKTEMDYYLEHNYPKAWYDDNVGSFLVIVEKNNRK